jgi:hypothetical protein
MNSDEYRCPRRCLREPVHLRAALLSLLKHSGKAHPRWVMQEANEGLLYAVEIRFQVGIEDYLISIVSLYIGMEQVLNFF